MDVKLNVVMRGCATGSWRSKQSAVAVFLAAFLLIGCGTSGSCMAAAAPAASPALGRGGISVGRIDAVDVCLIICDSCFKGDVVVRCANTCIRTEARMGGPWVLVCPRFYDSPAASRSIYY